MSHQIELPDTVYAELVKASMAVGTTPAGWIAARLPTGNGEAVERVVNAEEIAEANARLFANGTSMGRPTGTDNEAIDADLVRAYEENGAPAAKPEPEP